MPLKKPSLWTRILEWYHTRRLDRQRRQGKPEKKN